MCNVLHFREVQKTYDNGISPMPEKDQWERVDLPYEVLPPNVTRQAGRPQHMRKRSKHEVDSSQIKKQQRCKRCKNYDHRISTCKQPSTSPRPTPKPVGRPHKENKMVKAKREQKV